MVADEQGVKEATASTRALGQAIFLPFESQLSVWVTALTNEPCSPPGASGEWCQEPAQTGTGTPRGPDWCHAEGTGWAAAKKKLYSSPRVS